MTKMASFVRTRFPEARLEIAACRADVFQNRRGQHRARRTNASSAPLIDRSAASRQARAADASDRQDHSERTEKIIGTWRRGGRVLERGKLLAQQPPRRQHESDGGSQHRKAERRPTEEIERREAVPRNSLSIIMLGEDAIRVIIPLISAATNGMSMRLLFKPVFLATVRTKGMNVATIAEELVQRANASATS